MNEVETLRTLLSEQIKRNADLHVMLARAAEEVNEARRERAAAWEELSVLKAKMKEEAK